MRKALEIGMLRSINSRMEVIMGPEFSAVLIAQPGRFRDGIQILLISISQISKVVSTESLNEALSLAVCITPAIVILDSRVTNNDLPVTLNLLGDIWKGASRIVLVEDNGEYQQAMGLHTELVLLKGFNASKFIDSVEELLKNR